MTTRAMAMKLSWEDIRAFTPLLFFQREWVSPPLVARRLWAAISDWRLNEYDTAVERSGALSVLMTLAMIFQEFQHLVFNHKALLAPESIATYLGIGREHIAQILDENKIQCTQLDSSAKDVLILDDINRGCVAEAILDYFPNEEYVFRLLAFPVGLSRRQQQMTVTDLINEIESSVNSDIDTNRSWSSDFNWQKGFEFIKSGFDRTINYSV